MASPMEVEEGFPWGLGVFDAHCHPTETMSTVPDIYQMNARVLTVMSSRAQDQDLVENLANELGVTEADMEEIHTGERNGIIPSFGRHPWFSHQVYDDSSEENGFERPTKSLEFKILHYKDILYPLPEDEEFLSSLPDPIPLSSLIEETRGRLEKYPSALVGEIGLDRAFRIPFAWLPSEKVNSNDWRTPGGREGRSLSPYRVSLEHQRKIFLAQLRLAGQMQRPVSVHGVQAHGFMFDTLEQSWKGHERRGRKYERKRQKRALDWDTESCPMDEDESPPEFPPRICLHSYSGSHEPLKQYLRPSVPAEVFFSFSMVVNFSTSASAKSEQVIKALPDDRILIESDLHSAGTEMDNHLRQIAEKVCELKGWTLTEGVRKLAHNWEAFTFGSNSESA